MALRRSVGAAGTVSVGVGVGTGSSSGSSASDFSSGVSSEDDKGSATSLSELLQASRQPINAATVIILVATLLTMAPTYIWVLEVLEDMCLQGFRVACYVFSMKMFVFVGAGVFLSA